MRTLIAKARSSALARNTLWMFLGQGLRIIVQAVYFIVIARLLGPAQYGAFVAVVALVAILAPFATLGFGNLLIKNVVRDRSAFAVSWGNALLVAMVSASLLFGVTATDPATFAVISVILAGWLWEPFLCQLDGDEG